MHKNNKEIYTVSGDLLSILEIMYEYCKNNQDCENMARIFPIVKILCKKADNLHYKISNFEGES